MLRKIDPPVRNRPESRSCYREPSDSKQLTMSDLFRSSGGDPIWLICARQLLYLDRGSAPDTIQARYAARRSAPE